MPVKAYTCTDGEFKFTDDMKKYYDENGFILVKGLFCKEEVDHIDKALVSGPYPNYTMAVSDGAGREVEMIKWTHPGNDVTGMVSRCEKMAGTCEKLLGGEVYHYHTKIMMKPPRTGGKHLWHQDYGYWYTYGFVRPDMITAFIAVDDCLKINGCLQILKGSHKIGRIDHGLTGSQLGASDLDRVKEIESTCPLEYVEMDQGDVLFFHCNLLHRSNSNNSDRRRWAFISCYNKTDNKMVNEDTAKFKLGHGTPLVKVPDSAVLACKEFDNVEGKEFVLAKDRPFQVRKVGKAQE